MHVYTECVNISIYIQMNIIIVEYIMQLFRDILFDISQTDPIERF